MKKLATLALVCCASMCCFAQKLPKQFESSLKQNPSVEYFETNKTLGTPSFIRFKSTNLPDVKNVEALISDIFQLEKPSNTLLSISTTPLKSGITVDKYKQVFNGVTVEHSAIIVNQMGGKIHSISAEVFDFSNLAKGSKALTETAALDMALGFVNAEEYSWQAF